jgi:hypothetical protein
MAESAARAPYEGHPGWAALVMERDYTSALAAFGGSTPRPAGQARVHLEMSEAFRQAALLAARSTTAVWRDERREEDPPQVDCVVGISEVLLGEPEAARGHLSACRAATTGPLALTAGAWLAWLEGGAAWPPDGPLAATPGATEPVAPGGWPTPGTLPHYVFSDVVEGREVRVSDPATELLHNRS